MRERDEMVYGLARLGLSLYSIRKVLACLPAIQRAHEAECMAWPEAMVERFAKRGNRAWALLGLASSPHHMDESPRPLWCRQHDPRGACVEVYAPGVDRHSGEPMLRLGAQGFTQAQVEQLDMYAASPNAR